MKLLILAGPGPQRDRLLEAAGGIGAESIRVADDWAALVKAVATTKPEAILLSHAALAQRGPAALHAADVTLVALGIPAVIVLDAEEADRRAAIESSTRFEYFLTPPHDARHLGPVLEHALHLTGDQAAAPGSARAAREDQPVQGDGGFVRQRTPKATPAHGVAKVWDLAGGADGRNARPEEPAPSPPEASRPSFFGGRGGNEEIAAMSEVDTRPVDAVAEALSAPFDEEREPTGRGVGSQTAAPDVRGFDEPPERTDRGFGTVRTAPPRPSEQDEPPSRLADTGSGTLEDPIALGSESGAIPAVHETQPASPMFPDPPPDAPEPGRDDSGLWTGSSASIRLPRPEPGLPQLTMEMPSPNDGDLSKVPVAQVFITLSMVRATGELTLSTGALARRVVLLDGDPGTVFDPPGPDDEAKLLGTFMWSSGAYSFEPKDVPPGKFHPFGDPMSIVFRGIERHMGLNETATALGPYLQKYPVQTDHIRRFRRVKGLEKLPKFLRSSDGSRTLESLIGEAGADTEHVLRLAYFAWLAGSVVFADAPITGPIPVEFNIPRISHAASSGSHRAAWSGANRAVSGAQAAAAPEAAEPRASISTGAQRKLDAQQAALTELEAQWKRVSSAGAYEVFELEPGCGMDAVNTRFYELVRSYHPDRYANAGSAQVQSLAERIFLHIRRLQTEIAESERGAGPVSPDMVGGAALDSGVQRRRRRAAAMSGASPRSNTTPGGEPQVESEFTRDPSAPHARISQGRRVEGGDSGPYADVAQSGPGAHAAVRSATYRGMSAEQAMRNARAATDQGNYGKAMELLQVARSRGGTGHILEAYSVFLTYTQDYITAGQAIDGLDEILDSAEDPVIKAAVLTLCGHVCRAEEMNKDAVKYYERAMKESPDSESAARWLRYLRRRIAEDDKKKPFSASFLNRLFTPKPK